MSELNLIEEEIEKLLRKMEDERGIYHLTPAEIQKIENKRELLIFLNNPKNKKVCWKFGAYVETSVSSPKSISYLFDDIFNFNDDDIKEYLKFEFTGEWSIGFHTKPDYLRVK